MLIDPAGLHPVFAYGSNMDLADLDRWLAEKGHRPGRPATSSPAVLEGWRLVWNYDSPTRRGGAANIEPAVGARLPGALLYVDGPLLAALDQKEGHPERYRRRRLPVRGPAATVEAWAYVVTAPWRSSRAIWPRRVYLETVLRGARAFDLPPAHIAAIAATPTVDG